MTWHDSGMKRFALVLLFAGCTHTTYAFTPYSNKALNPKPKGCPVEVFGSAPTDRDYEEVGTVLHYNGAMPKDLEAFKKAVSTTVCEVGGDAAIGAPDEKGGYSKGSIIKWLGRLAEPLKKPTEMPTVQQPDTEVPPQ